MPLTHSGREFISKSIHGDATIPFNEANALLAVGNGTTAFNATQTKLQGATVAFGAMDPGYPKRVGSVITYQSTFSGGSANFAWEEWGIVNSSAVSGELLNRVVESNGEKLSGQAWILQVELTLVV